MKKFNFQFCPKIIVFSTDLQSVLLCKRKGEKDYNGIFSFIGGKMEITDGSILEGIKREKDEEVGSDFKINIDLNYSSNLFFEKHDGSKMILPHYFAVYSKGDINLSEEYSEYKWVRIKELGNFEPKIKNIHQSVKDMQLLIELSDNQELVEI